jgi:hypothetical protein
MILNYQCAGHTSCYLWKRHGCLASNKQDDQHVFMPAVLSSTLSSCPHNTVGPALVQARHSYCGVQPMAAVLASPGHVGGTLPASRHYSARVVHLSQTTWLASSPACLPAHLDCQAVSSYAQRIAPSSCRDCWSAFRRVYAQPIGLSTMQQQQQPHTHTHPGTARSVGGGSPKQAEIRHQAPHVCST